MDDNVPMTPQEEKIVAIHKAKAAKMLAAIDNIPTQRDTQRLIRSTAVLTRTTSKPRTKRRWWCVLVWW
jgi:hypothetical protein